MFADAEAGLFSLKIFASLIASYYISLRIGFSQPVWALSTVVFVSQPMAGQVLSKALYRMMGTVLGGAATVAFLPAFVNEPIALSFVLALWLGFCLYIALLDRTPRSYVFLLAGYTASIIGFPSVMLPGSIFNTAVLGARRAGVGNRHDVPRPRGRYLPRTHRLSSVRPICCGRLRCPGAGQPTSVVRPPGDGSRRRSAAPRE